MSLGTTHLALDQHEGPSPNRRSGVLMIRGPQLALSGEETGDAGGGNVSVAGDRSPPPNTAINPSPSGPRRPPRARSRSPRVRAGTSTSGPGPFSPPVLLAPVLPLEPCVERGDYDDEGDPGPPVPGRREHVGGHAHPHQPRRSNTRAIDRWSPDEPRMRRAGDLPQPPWWTPRPRCGRVRTPPGRPQTAPSPPSHLSRLSLSPDSVGYVRRFTQGWAAPSRRAVRPSFAGLALDRVVTGFVMRRRFSMSTMSRRDSESCDPVNALAFAGAVDADGDVVVRERSRMFPGA